MPKVSDIVSVTVGLSATPPSTASFGISCLVVDDVNVPIDRRQIQVTRSSYGTDLTSGTDAYSWCSTLWGQTYGPEKAYIGRWVSSASPSHFILPNVESTIATWSAVTAGDFGLSIGGVPTVLVTTGTMAAVTSIADVAAIIQTAVQALVGDWATCTVTVDALGRMVLSNSTTGASSDAVSFTAPTGGAGTDISTVGFLGVATGFAQAGLDAEDPEDALAAILLLTNEPFCFCERGSSIAQQVSFSTAVNAQSKLCWVVVNDTDGKDSGASTDAGYLINALSHQKTRVLYHEDSTINPDAAECGEIMPRTEANTHFAFVPLTGVPASGLDADGTTVREMTPTNVTALLAKGYDYYSTPSTLTHAMTGLASGGNEFRIMYGKLFVEAMISAAVYGYMVAQNVVTFSDDDILAIQGNITYWLDVMVSRKVLDAGYTITMPAASDFTAAIKATHIMDLDDVSESDAQIAVNKVNITLTWNV